MIGNICSSVHPTYYILRSTRFIIFKTMRQHMWDDIFLLVGRTRLGLASEKKTTQKMPSPAARPSQCVGKRTTQHVLPLTRRHTPFVYVLKASFAMKHAEMHQSWFRGSYHIWWLKKHTHFTQGVERPQHNQMGWSSRYT